MCYGSREEAKSSEYDPSVAGRHILGSSSSVSESSSAEKSIAGLLSNADEQLRRAREYNNRMAQKMYTHTRHNLHTLTHTHTHRESLSTQLTQQLVC